MKRAVWRDSKSKEANLLPSTDAYRLKSSRGMSYDKSVDARPLMSPDKLYLAVSTARRRDADAI
jgi:hypothetical protein